MSISQSLNSPGCSVSQAHGDLTVSPCLDALSLAAIASWREKANQSSDIDFLGVTLSELRRQARLSVVRMAGNYTAQYRSVSSSIISDALSVSQRPLIMGGHQPDLFHCGVWFKNFLLSRVAESSGGTAIHFLVDNDWCRSTGIRVPMRTSSGWTTQAIAYDQPRPETPWESCVLKDLSCWNSFPQRVRNILPPLNEEPILDRMWVYAHQHARQGGPLGNLLSRCRHLIEKELGLDTLEIPLSQLVSTEEFGWFSMRLIEQLPRLHEIYNGQLNQYRQNHKIRNHAQPLPDLGQTEHWLEAPWWCHRSSTSRRDPLWVKVTPTSIELSNRQDWQWSIETPLSRDSAADQWQKIAGSGMYLRPRALLTTMYARLILSDLFIHGTGGARYDQLTDRIISEFFGIEPPPVGMATATLHLPFACLGPQDTESVEPLLSQLQHQLQAAQSNPEAIFDSSQSESAGSDGKTEAVWRSEPSWQTELNSLIEQKRMLLSRIPPKGEKWEWHSAIKQVNSRLKELAAPRLNHVAGRIQELQLRREQQAIIHSREFSFCLFPSETVMSVFSQIPATSAD